MGAVRDLYIVSLGPGGEEYVTPLACRRLAECEALVGLSGQLLPVPQDKPLYQEKGISALFARLEALAGKKVAVVVSGDAGLFSLAQAIIKRYGPEAVREVVPGVSSLQVAFARLKESWEGVQVFSFHGRKMQGLEKILLASRAAIFCDRENSARRIVEALLDAGLSLEKTRVFVCQDLTLPREKIQIITTPEELATLSPARRELVILLRDVE